MSSTQDFQLFLGGLQNKLQRDQLLIQELVADYRSKDWESLYARLCHEYPRQAGQILVESMGLTSEEASDPDFIPTTTLLEKYLFRYIRPAGLNRWIVELPLPVTDGVKQMVAKHLFVDGKYPEALRMKTISSPKALVLYVSE